MTGASIATRILRRVAGTPIGGQFAPRSRLEPEVSLVSAGRPVTDATGITRWHDASGWLHRDGGPAIEMADGSRQWWVNGRCHRDDGPAVEWADGSQMWVVDGRRHRTDGPAVEMADGSRQWWVDGRQLTEDEFHSRFPGVG